MLSVRVAGGVVVVVERSLAVSKSKLIRGAQGYDSDDEQLLVGDESLEMPVDSDAFSRIVSFWKSGDVREFRAPKSSSLETLVRVAETAEYLLSESARSAALEQLLLFLNKMPLTKRTVTPPTPLPVTQKSPWRDWERLEAARENWVECERLVDAGIGYAGWYEHDWTDAPESLLFKLSKLDRMTDDVSFSATWGASFRFAFLKKSIMIKIERLEKTHDVAGLREAAEGEDFDSSEFEAALQQDDFTRLLELDRLYPLDRCDATNLVGTAARFVKAPKPEIISWLMTIDDVSRRNKLRFKNLEMARAFLVSDVVSINKMSSSERIATFEKRDHDTIRCLLFTRLGDHDGREWLHDAAVAGVDFDVKVQGELLLERAIYYNAYVGVVAQETTTLRDSKGITFKSQMSSEINALVRRTSTLRRIQALRLSSVLKVELERMLII